MRKAINSNSGSLASAWSPPHRLIVTVVQLLTAKTTTTTVTTIQKSVRRKFMRQA